MRADEAAVRYADMHTGFTLVDVEEVGLPFLELRLDVMAQKRHPLPVIDEYVLRLAHLGVRSPGDVGGMLGLEPALVQRSVVALCQSDYIDYVPGPHGRQVVLTPTGSEVLAQRMEQVPERSVIWIGFDRLLWKLSTRWMRELEGPQLLKQAGTRMAPAQRKRNPRPDEIDVAALNPLLVELPNARRARIDYDVLHVLNVGARTKCLRALMLVFVADDDSTARASFVIDGQPSPDHDRAFEDVGGLERLGIEPAGAGSADRERPALPEELEALRPDRATVARLDRRRRSTKAAIDAALADAAVEQPEGAASGSPGGGQGEEDDEVDALHHELRAVEAEQAALPLRPISTFEHRVLLEEALDTARRRLLVIAPWVRSSVVDQGFLDRMRLLGQAGVEVHIGYGIRKDDPDGHDRAAVAALERLASRHPNVVLRNLGHTHAKVLVWDDRMVVTSFNWLSFRGDRRRRYRQEEGVLITEPSYVEQEYRRHRAEIEGP